MISNFTGVMSDIFLAHVKNSCNIVILQVLNLQTIHETLKKIYCM